MGLSSSRERGWAALDAALAAGKPVVTYGWLSDRWRAQFPSRVGSGNVGHINAILGRTGSGNYIVNDPMHEGGAAEMNRTQLAVFYELTSGGTPEFTALGAGGSSGTVTGIAYQAHVQNIGWQGAVSNGQVAGTEGQSLRVEALKSWLQKPAGSAARVCYQAHVENIGWQPARCEGDVAGTTGQNLRVEALKVWLEGAPGKRVCYQTHVQNIGWQGEVCDGAVAGTTGQNLRIEAFKVRIQ